MQEQAIKTPVQIINYEEFSIKDIRADISTDVKTGKKEIERVTIGGQEVAPTPRFWNSLYSKFGFSGSFFNYFSPEEVLNRIAEVRPDERVRVCLQQEPGAEMKSVLAVSSPHKPYLPYDQVVEILANGDPLSEITLSNGIIRASYAPRGESRFSIAGDEFESRFDTFVPIDGYGAPSTVLGTLRLVCANGLVALSKIFQNRIPIGAKDNDGGLARIIQTLESFGNDEGYAALRSRLESATTSMASVAECNIIQKSVLQAMSGQKREGSESEALKDLLNTFDRMFGNFGTLYGLVNENSIGQKRLQTLPSRATVYDLMNYATEISTHYVPNELKRRNVQGIIGEMLSKEYDLEGSAKNGRRDFIDLYVDSEMGSGIKTGADNRLSDLEDMQDEFEAEQQ